MIDVELAKTLLPLVNDDFNMNLLKDYVKYRIEWLRDELEKNVTPDSNRGAITELRRMLGLREEVIADSRNKPKG